jgi:DNA polymerase
MDRLWLDFETRSMLNLKEVGLDRYAKDPSTEVLMLAWAFNDEPPELWEPRFGKIPERLHQGLIAHDILKAAWNYNFEKDILQYKLGYAIDQDEWTDPSVLCADMSLPVGLDRASQAMDLDEAEKKIITKGDDRLVKIFSALSKRTKTFLKKNPGSAPVYFRDWNTDPEKWAEFCDYCKGDVRAERAVWYAVTAFDCKMTHGEIQAWLLDQRMNERGVWVDRVYVANAKKLALDEINGIVGEMKSLTGLENPNSTQQLGEWLRARKYPFQSLDKEHVDEAIKEHARFNMSPLALQVLELKKKLGGSAYTKLQTIEDRIGEDGRLRDQFVYHGAHTGRWSGRGVQLQNLFKPNKDVNTVRDEIVQGIKTGTLDLVKIVDDYNAGVKKHNQENPTKKKKPIKPITLMAAIAGTIRSAFAATPGKILDVGDLAQIESRVLAALAGCQTMIDAYASGADLYCDFMTWLLKRLVTKADSDERARGKIVILGCGFGMGIDKFITYAASFGVTLTEKEAQEAVYGFREKYPEIPAYWKALDRAVKQAVKANICVYVRGIVIDGRNPKMLKIRLPSGRCLHYLNPVITNEQTEWGEWREGVSYDAWDKKGLNVKRLYGGLITENIVQAVARDILLNGMFEAEKLGFELIMTIHDEIAAERSLTSTLTLGDLLGAMQVVPEWGEGMGFVLAAEGYEDKYYHK